MVRPAARSTPWNLGGLALALLVGGSGGDARGEPPAAVQRFIECEAVALMEAEGLPSLSLGLVEGDRAYWSRAWGFANRDPCIPATPRSLYETASMAKPVTAVALLSALPAPPRGSLGDFVRRTPVTAWLPSTVDGTRAITLSMLLAHRTTPTGIATHDDPMLWGFEERRPLGWDLDAWRLGTIPDDAGSLYSNTAYVMAGYILAVLCAPPGESPDWPHCERAWRRLVSDPLGAPDTGLEVRPESMERLVLPYAPRSEGHRALPIAVHRQHSSWGAYTTAPDYASFLGACLSRGSWQGGPALSPRAVEACLESPEGATPALGTTHGHGWQRVRSATENLIRKSGVGYTSGCYALGDLTDGRGGCVFTSSYGADPDGLKLRLRGFLETCLAAMRGPVPSCAPNPTPPGVVGPYVDRSMPGAWPPRVALVRATAAGLLVLLPDEHHLLLPRTDSTAGAFVYYDRKARTFRDATLSQDPDKPRLLQLPTGSFTRMEAASPLPATPPGGSANWKDFHNVWEGFAEPVPRPYGPAEEDDATPPRPPTRVVLDVRPGDAEPTVTLTGLGGRFVSERATNLRTDGQVLHAELPGGARLEPTWMDLRLEQGRLVGFHRSGVKLERVVLRPRVPSPVRLEDLDGLWRGDLWILGQSVLACPERVELRFQLDTSGAGVVHWVVRGTPGDAPVQAAAVQEHVEIRVQGTAALFSHFLLEREERLAGWAHASDGRLGHLELTRIAPAARAR